MMLRALRATGLIVLLTSALFGQSFEVASIRVHSGPLHAMETFSTSGPQLKGEGVSLLYLIMYAYDLKPYQISTPPLGPVGETRFELLAKAEGDASPTKATFRLMMQALLAERFQLKFHREMREMPVYALVVGKNGPKFKESAPDSNAKGGLGPNGRNFEIKMPKGTLEDMLQVIGVTTVMDRPVIDKTGLAGTYDIRLLYTPSTRTNRDDPDPSDISIFTAVQDQLGLKLEAQKAKVEVLVVDHVEKPSEN